MDKFKDLRVKSVVLESQDPVFDKDRSLAVSHSEKMVAVSHLDVDDYYKDEMRLYGFDSQSSKMTRLAYTADIPLGMISVENSGQFTPNDKYLLFEVVQESNAKCIARVDLENQNIYFLRQAKSNETENWKC